MLILMCKHITHMQAGVNWRQVGLNAAFMYTLALSSIPQARHVHIRYICMYIMALAEVPWRQRWSECGTSQGTIHQPYQKQGQSDSTVLPYTSFKVKKSIWTGSPHTATSCFVIVMIFTGTCSWISNIYAVNSLLGNQCSKHKWWLQVDTENNEMFNRMYLYYVCVQSQGLSHLWGYYRLA